MTLHLPPFPERPPLGDDPEWYRTSVFYEVLVRGFSDLNGDGSGELRGIIDQCASTLQRVRKRALSIGTSLHLSYLLARS